MSNEDPYAAIAEPAPAAANADPYADIAVPATPPTQPKSFWQSMKDRIASNIESNSQPIVGDHSPAAALHNFGAAAGRVVTGLPGYAKDVGTAAIHSVKSGQPNELLDILNPFDQIGAVTDQFKSDYAKDPALAFENLAGTGAGMAATAGLVKAAPKVAGKVADVLPKVSSVTGPVKVAAETITKTTPRATQELVTKTAEQNAAAADAAAEANAAQTAQRALDLKKHLQQTQAVTEANQAAQGAASRKTALLRGVEQLDPQFQDRLNNLEKNVRAQASGKYDVVRAKVGAVPVESDTIANAVKNAESKISGSSENIKVFRDILSKAPEAEPETIAYQGANIPKGHPLYDVLKSQGESPTPLTFNDLQGYYTEIGSKLAQGNLPGDIYQALKSLHNDIGNIMQGVADQGGVGPQFKDARAFYKKYMDTFRESTSPVNKAINATERGKAIQALQGKDQSGIQAIAQYDPDLAQSANTIRGYQAEAKGTKAGPLKSLPVLKPAKAPVVPNVTQLGPEDIQAMKAGRVIAKGNQIADSSGNIANAIAGMAMAKALISGNMSAVGLDIAARTAYGMAKQGVAKLLTNPTVVDWLSKPTPKDLEILRSLPPDQLKASIASMKPVVDAANAKGIKVHPAIQALVAGEVAAGSATKSAKKSVAAALAPVGGTTSSNPYVTQLAPQDEAKFQDWVKTNKIPWQDTPNADYDMRGYWQAQQAGDPNARQAANRHFPDTFKTPFHKTFSNESKYATANAPHWEGNRLIDPSGRVIADESQ